MKTLLALALFSASATPAFATDVINQDGKAYKLTILDGSYTSSKTIAARGSFYGLCGSGPCTFSIKGSKLAGVGKNDRIIINGGKIKRP